MKKLLVSFGLMALGLAAGLSAPRIAAQSDSPAAVQKWEQFCEMPDKIRNKKPENRIQILSALMKKYGEEGYELVGIPGGEVVCLRRPAR